MSLLKYMARPIFTRCFCPPLNVMPRSPISVPSPSCRARISPTSQPARKEMVRVYQETSRYLPPRHSSG